MIISQIVLIIILIWKDDYCVMPAFRPFPCVKHSVKRHARFGVVLPALSKVSSNIVFARSLASLHLF